jgi:hypothetical protein
MRAPGQPMPAGWPARGPDQVSLGLPHGVQRCTSRLSVCWQAVLTKIFCECRMADHSILLHFDGMGASGSCALMMTSRGSHDLVRACMVACWHDAIASTLRGLEC